MAGECFIPALPTVVGSVPTTMGCRRMLVRRLTTILPDLILPEALDTSRIHRVAVRIAGRTAVGAADPPSV
jgi:predicted ATPase with chaperone activity